MTDRVDLQSILEGILGTRHVYFQPPENLKIQYPAIIYTLRDIKSVFANDKMYNNDWQYQVILVDEDPDSRYITPILEIPKCRFMRSYVSDNLNHFLFYIYH